MDWFNEPSILGADKHWNDVISFCIEIAEKELQEINISSLTIEVINHNTDYLGCQRGYKVEVSKRCKSLLQEMHTLLHELRHVWQFVCDLTITEKIAEDDADEWAHCMIEKHFLNKEVA